MVSADAARASELRHARIGGPILAPREGDHYGWVFASYDSSLHSQLSRHSSQCAPWLQYVCSNFVRLCAF